MKSENGKHSESATQLAVCESLTYSNSDFVMVIANQIYIFHPR